MNHAPAAVVAAVIAQAVAAAAIAQAVVAAVSALVVAGGIVAVVIATSPSPEPVLKPCPDKPGCGPKGRYLRRAEPRTGKALILATKEFACEDRATSWWVVLSTLVYFAIAITGTLLPWAWPAKLICSVITALLMVRVFVIFHDHQHRAILDRSFAADFLMRFVGILALTPSSIWKSSHNYHHSHNSKLRSARIGSFPIMTQEHYAEASFVSRFVYRFMRHPLTMLCGYLTVFMGGMSLLPFIEAPRKHLDGLLALLLHFAFATTLVLFAGWTALLFTLVIPFSIAMAIGTYLFYIQHNFPDVLFRDAQGWTYEGAALDSSSFCQMPRLMHWFTANIGYHHIHHLNAKIPFYRLPEVMRALPELQHPKRISLSPRDMWTCLRLTVWDVSAQRLVPLAR